MSKSILSVSLIAVLLVVAIAAPSYAEKKVAYDNLGNVTMIDDTLKVDPELQKLQAVVACQRKVDSELKQLVEQINARTSNENLEKLVEKVVAKSGINPATPKGQATTDQVKQKAIAGILSLDDIQKAVRSANRAANIRSWIAIGISLLVLVLLILLALRVEHLGRCFKEGRPGDFRTATDLVSRYRDRMGRRGRGRRPAAPPAAADDATTPLDIAAALEEDDAAAATATAEAAEAEAGGATTEDGATPAPGDDPAPEEEA